MKKRTLITALFLFVAIAVKAQTAAEITNNFKALLVESVTDFKNIQGEIVENDAENKVTYYACKKTLGSTLEAICLNANDNTAYFSAKYDYGITDELLKATEILPSLLVVINDMVKTGKYTGRDYTNNSNVEITEVKDLDGNYILEIESGADNKYLRITIYGKSWGKK
jgi:proline dehydrogenase